GVPAVRVGSWIYEARLAEDGALHAQQIGVAVAAAAGPTQGADVENQLMGIGLPAGPHDHAAAVGEEPRGRQPRRRRSERVERAKPRGSEQPQDFGGGGSRGPRTVRADRKSTRLNSSHVKISYAVF